MTPSKERDISLAVTTWRRTEFSTEPLEGRENFDFEEEICNHCGSSSLSVISGFNMTSRRECSSKKRQRAMKLGNMTNVERSRGFRQDRPTPGWDLAGNGQARLVLDRPSSWKTLVWLKHRSKSNLRDLFPSYKSDRFPVSHSSYVCLTMWKPWRRTVVMHCGTDHYQSDQMSTEYQPFWLECRKICQPLETVLIWMAIHSIHFLRL